MNRTALKSASTKTVASFSLLVIAAACGKTTRSAETKLTNEQNRIIQGSGDTVAKKDDDLQNQINKLNEKVDSHYTEFSAFKEYAKENFRKLYDKLQGHDKIFGLEEDGAKASGDEGLYKIIQQLRGSVGTLRTEVTNLNEKTTAQDTALAEYSKKVDDKLVVLEGNINTALNKASQASDSAEAFRLSVEKSNATVANPFSADKQARLTLLLSKVSAAEKDSYVKIVASAGGRAAVINQKLAALAGQVGELNSNQKLYQTCLSLSLEVASGKEFSKYDELESCFNGLTDQQKDEIASIRESVKSIADRTYSLEETQKIHQRDFEAYKSQAARTFATKAEVANLRIALQRLEEANTVLYTSISTVDQKYAGKIRTIDESINGLRNDFAREVNGLKDTMRAQKFELQGKLTQLESSLRSGQQALAEKLQRDITGLARTFGESTNEISFALNQKMEALKTTVGKDNSELKIQLENLRSTQLEQQQTTGAIAESIKSIVTRLGAVEDVARKALNLSEANGKAIGLMQKDFEAQAKAVAQRFEVNESKVQSLSENVEAFKRQTDEKFRAVEQNAASMVSHLDSKIQGQFRTVSGDIAKLKVQANATQQSVGSLFLKVGSLEGRTDYLSKLVQFQNLYKNKLNVSMDGIKATLIAAVDVETEFVKALAVSKQNHGEFDKDFRARLNVQDKCGIEPEELDFARAADVDYFSWLARVYVRDLMFGIRSATPNDGIFFGKERLVAKDSLAELLFLNMTALSGHKAVPAACYSAIDAFAKEVHFGSGGPNQTLRTRLLQSELKNKIGVLESRMANVSGSLGQLEIWLESQAKEIGVISGDLPQCKADLVTAIYDQAKLLIDIEDKRAEFRKISELSIAVATQHIALTDNAASIAEQRHFADSLKTELENLSGRLVSNLADVNRRIGELEASSLASDKQIAEELKAQKLALEKQRDANTAQITALGQSFTGNIAAVKASIEDKMKKQFDAFEDTLEGIQAEQKSYGIPTQKQDVALNAIFSIISTLAARGGHADLVASTILASQNFSGSAPGLLPTFLPKVNLVQHYFSSGFVKGSANACLTLDEASIQRSPFNWACNVNFRKLTNDQRVGTASSAALRIHGQFQGIEVEAWRSSTWSWDLALKPTLRTFPAADLPAAIYQVPGANLPNVPSLVKVAGSLTSNPAGDSGVFDVPSAGAIFASLVDNNKSQFNGLIKVTPFRPAMPNEVAAPGYSISGGRLSGSTFNYIVGLYSPLVLKFDNQGLDTVLPSQSRINFDMNDNGIAERTGWISQKGAGFLALPNAKGEVVTGAQLFGQATKIGNKRARNGYEALAQFDTANKGFIDKSDSVFKKLVVWFDNNQDGVAQSNEMKSLKDLGVTRIDTTFGELPNHLAKQGDSMVDVNMIKYQSKFYGPKSCNGGVCQSYDVYFGAVEMTQAKR